MRVTFLSKYEYFLQGVNIENLPNQKYCVFDLEGTGIHFETEHITQFGAVILQNGEIIEEFSSLVHSPKRIPPEIERLTGISNAEIENAPAFPEVYQHFLEFCEGTVLVTQAGYEYDVPMLENHCREYGTTMFSNPVIDTKALFANLHKEYRDVISTNFLIHYYKIEEMDVPRHNALGDCIVISRIFKSILEEYKRENIRDFIVSDGIAIKRFVIPGMYLDNEIK